MVTMAEIEAIVRTHTNDPRILADFYAAAANHARRDASSGVALAEYLRLEREVRLGIFKAQVKQGAFGHAAKYAKEHGLLPPGGWTAFASEWCEAKLEEFPYEALDVAREYGLADLAHEAARKEGERILASKQDVTRALEIARRELAYDSDYRRRAARRAFAQYIDSRSFGSLPGLVVEFRDAFSEVEVAAADFLDRAEKERNERRYAKLKSG